MGCQFAHFFNSYPRSPTWTKPPPLCSRSMSSTRVGGAHLENGSTVAASHRDNLSNVVRRDFSLEARHTSSDDQPSFLLHHGLGGGGVGKKGSSRRKVNRWDDVVRVHSLSLARLARHRQRTFNLYLATRECALPRPCSPAALPWSRGPSKKSHPCWAGISERTGEGTSTLVASCLLPND